MNDTIPQDNTPRKQCGKCDQWKPANSIYFGANKSIKDGFANTCKQCRKELYDANREQELQQKKVYHQQHRDRLIQRSRQYYHDHAEALREQKRQYRKEYKSTVDLSKKKYDKSHPEQIRAYHRNYRKAYPDKVAQFSRATSHNRRARKQKAEGRYTTADIRRQYDSQKGKCYYCQEKLNKYHVDHIVPLSREGSNRPDNLVLTCPFCNRSKGAKLPHEWHEGGRLL